MNYPPNTKDWQVGDLVIHDADAKRLDMIMVVVVEKTGDRYLLEYPIPRVPLGKRYANSKEVLHDPTLFKLNVDHLRRPLRHRIWEAMKQSGTYSLEEMDGMYKELEQLENIVQLYRQSLVEKENERDED